MTEEKVAALANKKPKKASKNLVINLKRPSALTLPKSKKGNLKERDGLVLIPGENDVTSNYWNDIKGNKAVKLWCASDILEAKGEGKANSFGDGLDSLNLQDAMDRIASSKSVKALNGWMDKTNKSQVKKACKERIDEIIANTNNE